MLPMWLAVALAVLSITNANPSEDGCPAKVTVSRAACSTFGTASDVCLVARNQLKAECATSVVQKESVDGELPVSGSLREPAANDARCDERVEKALEKVARNMASSDGSASMDPTREGLKRILAPQGPSFMPQVMTKASLGKSLHARSARCQTSFSEALGCAQSTDIGESREQEGCCTLGVALAVLQNATATNHRNYQDLKREEQQLLLAQATPEQASEDLKPPSKKGTIPGTLQRIHHLKCPHQKADGYQMRMCHRHNLFGHSPQHSYAAVVSSFICLFSGPSLASYCQLAASGGNTDKLPQQTAPGGPAQKGEYWGNLPAELKAMKRDPFKLCTGVGTDAKASTDWESKCVPSFNTMYGYEPSEWLKFDTKGPVKGLGHTVNVQGTPIPYVMQTLLMNSACQGECTGSHGCKPGCIDGTMSNILSFSVFRKSLINICNLILDIGAILKLHTLIPNF